MMAVHTIELVGVVGPDPRHRKIELRFVDRATRKQQYVCLLSPSLGQTLVDNLQRSSKEGEKTE